MTKFLIITCQALIISLILVLPATAESQNKLQVYEVPRELLYNAHSDDFTVRVRSPGERWQNLYEYRVRVDKDTLQNASLVYFDFTGKVELEIHKNNGACTKRYLAPYDIRET